MADPFPKLFNELINAGHYYCNEIDPETQPLNLQDRFAKKANACHVAAMSLLEANPLYHTAMVEREDVKDLRRKIRKLYS